MWIFPDTGVDIIEPEFVEGLPDEAHALQEALRHPLVRGLSKTLFDQTTPLPLFSRTGHGQCQVIECSQSFFLNSTRFPLDQHYLDQCRWNTSDEHSRGTGVNAWKRDC